MAICRQACPYNTLDGCKVKEYGGICQLTNTVQPITEYRMTNADRIRAMSDDELNDLFNEIYNAGVEDAVSYEWGQRTNSFEWTMEWLQQPAEEVDNEWIY